jgi:predicted ATPase
MAIEGFAAPEVERAYICARGLCERLGDPPEYFWVLFGLQAVHFVRGEIRSAHELAKQLLPRAQSVNDQALLMYAHQALGCVSYQMGNLLLARENLEKAISLYDPERHRILTLRFNVDARVNSLSYLDRTLWLLGYPDQALKRGCEALALARELSHPSSLAFAENSVSLLHISRREARAARETAEHLMALSTEHGFAFWMALASIRNGRALAELERDEEAIAQIQEGLTALFAAGAGVGRPQNLSLLAEAYVKTGRLDDGLGALTEALVTGDENENFEFKSEILRLKGELLLKQNISNAAEAQGCFELAIEIARKQSAKSWELRATTSLSRLIARQNKQDEARIRLAEIYSWFTEGLDTADLIDAKALLDKLSG